MNLWWNSRFFAEKKKGPAVNVEGRRNGRKSWRSSLDPHKEKTKSYAGVWSCTMVPSGLQRKKAMAGDEKSLALDKLESWRGVGVDKDGSGKLVIPEYNMDDVPAAKPTIRTAGKRVMNAKPTIRRAGKLVINANVLARLRPDEANPIHPRFQSLRKVASLQVQDAPPLSTEGSIDLVAYAQAQLQVEADGNVKVIEETEQVQKVEGRIFSFAEDSGLIDAALNRTDWMASGAEEDVPKRRKAAPSLQLAVELPITKASFNEAKQKAYINSLTQAAGVPPQSVRIVNIEEKSGGKPPIRVYSILEIVFEEQLPEEALAAAAAVFAEGLTPNKIEKKLSKSGFPKAVMFEPATVYYTARSKGSRRSRRGSASSRSTTASSRCSTTSWSGLSEDEDDGALELFEQDIKRQNSLLQEEEHFMDVLSPEEQPKQLLLVLPKSPSSWCDSSTIGIRTPSVQSPRGPTLMPETRKAIKNRQEAALNKKKTKPVEAPCVTTELSVPTPPHPACISPRDHNGCPFTPPPHIQKLYNRKAAIHALSTITYFTYSARLHLRCTRSQLARVHSSRVSKVLSQAE